MQSLVEQFSASRVDIDVLYGSHSTGHATPVPDSLGSMGGNGSVEKKGTSSETRSRGLEKNGTSSETKRRGMEKLADDQNEDFPIYDVCPPIGITSMLSDSWSDNIKHVGQRFLG